MRLRLLRRRLTIAAPRVAVRSAMPWPLRWLLAAVVLGLSAAVALWTFEFGKSIAGLDAGARRELEQLRSEVQLLREQTRQQQTVAQTADTVLATERATAQTLATQVRQLEAENRSLRDDLGFFEKLIPASGAAGVSIRSLQAEATASGSLRWQVLVIQPVKNAPEFRGRLEIVLAGTQAGKPWNHTAPAGPPLQLQQYRRLEGVVTLPAQTVVTSVTARVWEGNTLRSTQTQAL